MNALAKVPPHNTEAENALLGFILCSKNPFVHLAHLNPDETLFYHQSNAEIFTAARKQFDNGSTRVDVFAMDSALSCSPAYQAAGGNEYVKKVIGGYSGKHTAMNAVATLRDTAKRRTIINSMSSIAAESFDLTNDIDTLRGEAEKTLQSISASGQSRTPETPAEITDQYLADLRRIQESGGVVGIQTPFLDFNRLTCGFAPGEVVILAARPACGKTALALNIADHAANNGHHVGIFSLEMSKHLLTNRLFSSSALVEAQKFRSSKFSASDWQSLEKYAEHFRHLPLHFSDVTDLKPSRFRDKCRMWKHDHGIDLVVIDYLQLMTPEKPCGNREREVAEMSRTIKTTAVELDVPILVLSQLNRAAEGTKKPLMSQLRESGAIEQDADQIIFICPWQNTPEISNPIVKIDCAKGRNNQVGSFQLLYRKNFVKFENYAGDRVTL